MPVVLRVDGLRFFFYSNEGSPLEPAHIHVSEAEAEAKFWLEPDVRLARNDGFNAATLRRVTTIVQSHQKTFRRCRDEYFTDYGSV
ncbi:DUF4160 domain-containing protein [Thiorhodovibrio frisius]|uniref:DUF4160 domain-containing protein n=1 Tax=Thiorhodovibrio frisius TaxID=631362 RepID=H8Z6Z9_9GAMM|nr:DUF4160 domain-containing protein [Thiorhodovibrio frisius]EIC19784.1 hypothetical protein Thi970DRAFT_03382 [Thiorhodovibrio frisius]WPL20243.1 hypothetical protein Thiofri_00319 [Thiorhodovibrio frisius]